MVTIKNTILSVSLALIALPFSAHASVDTLCSTLSYADYTPGIDVHGNAVVPADVQPFGNADLPQAIEIPMTINMAEYLGVVLPTGSEMPASFGSFAVFTDGRVTYQGRDLTHNATAACHNRQIGAENRPAELEGAAGAASAKSLPAGQPVLQTPTETLFTGEFE